MSASSESLALEYELTEQELASFCGEALARSRLYKWLWPQRRFLLGIFFLAAVLIAMMLFSDRPWWDDADTRLTISAAFGLFVLLIFVFDPLFSTLVIRHRIRSDKYRAYLQRIRVEIGSTTLKAMSVRSGETQEWRALRGIQLSRIGCVIYLPPGHALMIPKRPFESEAAFMAFMNKVNGLPREVFGKS